ncbi:MAG: DUF4118 domain-containing protein [Acidobacteria bacterium]|nr:DUF4118 domain-containing protein [Acidobacteriota bacterium]
MKRSIAVLVFPLVALALAIATSSVRNEMGVANTALLLAAIIVGAAVIDWTAGLVTACVGAIALNYFHTEPIHSLRITRTPDIFAVILLVALGSAVSAATALQVSERMRHYRTSLSQAAATDLRKKQHAPALWRAAVDAESVDLGLVDAHLVPSGTVRLPVIARHATTPDEQLSFHERVTIPATGAVVVLRDPRLHMDLVVEPREAGTSPDLRRSTIFMFADSVELSLTHVDGSNGRLSA